MTALINGGSPPVQTVARLVTATQQPVAAARVAVWGVKGGVGTTTTALLMGLTLARHRHDPVVVADQTLYGSLAVRAGSVLPAEPTMRPPSTDRPGIAIGDLDLPPVGVVLLDAPAPTDPADVEVLVVSTAVDAVLMAQGHTAPLVALTQLTPRSGLNLDTARDRLTAAGATVVIIPFDAHLSVGGPIGWDRLAPTTRDASRQLAAAVITAIADRTPQPTAMEQP